MKKLHLVPPSSKILNEVAKAVLVPDIASPKMQELIKQLFDVAYGLQGDAKKPTLVGLAAPQIGVALRVILVDIDADGSGSTPNLQEFINPEIIFIDKETVEGREGCFSTGRVCGIVKRSKKVRITGYDRSGNIINYELEGFPARVAQHEVDHLNGIRFPDRITDKKKLHWVEENEFGDYRNQWRTWDKLCSRKTWNEIKSKKSY